MSFSYVTFFPLFLQEIVGETSFTINGNEAQTFHWKGFGFKLHVPKNAFHPRSSNCTIIYVKAFLPNSYLELPENTELVSAIYYISMPSPITFKKGVEIEIQHCCKLVEGNQEKLNFVTLISSWLSQFHVEEGLRLLRFCVVADIFSLSQQQVLYLISHSV